MKNVCEEYKLNGSEYPPQSLSYAALIACNHWSVTAGNRQADRHTRTCTHTCSQLYRISGVATPCTHTCSQLYRISGVATPRSVITCNIIYASQSTLLLHLVLATLPIEFLTFKISNPVHSGGRSSVGHAIKAPPPMGPSFVRTPPQLNSLSQFLFCFVFRFFPLLV